MLLFAAAIGQQACDQAHEDPVVHEQTAEVQKEAVTEPTETVSSDTIITPERVGLDALVDIQLVDPSIRVDLRYAGTNNFMGKKLYHDIDRLYLQKDVAVRLASCQRFLKKQHPALSLLVYDGVRPLSVQQDMWDALDTIPVDQRVKFVSNPANGSIHNYGAAVDLTICDENGEPLDMGAGYDDIRKIAYPKFESDFLASGELTQAQVNNRKLLRAVMSSGGFRNIPTEWWHFNACSRAEAKKRYAILK